MERLALQHGVSCTTVKRAIYYWLDHAPSSIIIGSGGLSKVRYLIFDGTYLKRQNGIYAVMDGVTHRLVAGSFGIKEGQKDLVPFYQHLKQAGIRPKSATVDGNPQQTRYIKLVWPSIILQRCRVHVHRQGLRWCRSQPKRTDAKHLRQLFLRLVAVATSREKKRFVHDVAVWEHQYGHRIQTDRAKSKGWVLSDLALARLMLLHAIPDLFHFINDKRIPSSTNALEGYFGHIKQRYRQHAGLSRMHRRAYFQWYFTLNNAQA
jgi:transposase-like protein